MARMAYTTDTHDLGAHLPQGVGHPPNFLSTRGLVACHSLPPAAAPRAHQSHFVKSQILLAMCLSLVRDCA